MSGRSTSCMTLDVIASNERCRTFPPIRPWEICFKNRRRSLFGGRGPCSRPFFYFFPSLATCSSCIRTLLYLGPHPARSTRPICAVFPCPTYLVHTRQKNNIVSTAIHSCILSSYRPVAKRVPCVCDNAALPVPAPGLIHYCFAAWEFVTGT